MWVSRNSQYVGGKWVKGDKLRYGYFNIHDGFSRKRLRELHPNLERYINQKITDPNIVAILEAAGN